MTPEFVIAVESVALVAAGGFVGWVMRKAENTDAFRDDLTKLEKLADNRLTALNVAIEANAAKDEQITSLITQRNGYYARVKALRAALDMHETAEAKRQAQRVAASAAAAAKRLAK